MSEKKKPASLTSGLLARKGGASPAGRRDRASAKSVGTPNIRSDEVPTANRSAGSLSLVYTSNDPEAPRQGEILEPQGDTAEPVTPVQTTAASESVATCEPEKSSTRPNHPARSFTRVKPPKRSQQRPFDRQERGPEMSAPEVRAAVEAKADGDKAADAVASAGSDRPPRVVLRATRESADRPRFDALAQIADIEDRPQRERRRVARRAIGGALIGVLLAGVAYTHFALGWKIPSSSAATAFVTTVQEWAGTVVGAFPGGDDSLSGYTEPVDVADNSVQQQGLASPAKDRAGEGAAPAGAGAVNGQILDNAFAPISGAQGRTQSRAMATDFGPGSGRAEVANTPNVAVTAPTQPGPSVRAHPLEPVAVRPLVATDAAPRPASGADDRTNSVTVAAADAVPDGVRPRGASNAGEVGSAPQAEATDKKAAAPSAEAAGDDPRSVAAAPASEAADAAPSQALVGNPGQAVAEQSDNQVAAAPPTIDPIPVGKYAIQLAAVRNNDGAKREWQRLQDAFPEDLGDKTLVIREARFSDGGSIYRIQTGPFDAKDAASAICTRLKAASQDCLVLRRN